MSVSIGETSSPLSSFSSNRRATGPKQQLRRSLGKKGIPLHNGPTESNTMNGVSSSNTSEQMVLPFSSRRSLGPLASVGLTNNLTNGTGTNTVTNTGNSNNGGHTNSNAVVNSNPSGLGPSPIMKPHRASWKRERERVMGNGNGNSNPHRNTNSSAASNGIHSNPVAGGGGGGGGLSRNGSNTNLANQHDSANSSDPSSSSPSSTSSLPKISTSAIRSSSVPPASPSQSSPTHSSSSSTSSSTVSSATSSANSTSRVSARRNPGGLNRGPVQVGALITTNLTSFVDRDIDFSILSPTGTGAPAGAGSLSLQAAAARLRSHGAGGGGGGGGGVNAVNGGVGPGGAISPPSSGMFSSLNHHPLLPSTTNLRASQQSSPPVVSPSSPFSPTDFPSHSLSPSSTTSSSTTTPNTSSSLSTQRPGSARRSSLPPSLSSSSGSDFVNVDRVLLSSPICNDLFRVIRMCAACNSCDRMVSTIEREAPALVNAKEVRVLLIQRGGFIHTSGKLPVGMIHLNAGITGFARANRIICNVPDAQDDARFNREVDLPASELNHTNNNNNNNNQNNSNPSPGKPTPHITDLLCVPIEADSKMDCTGSRGKHTRRRW